MNCKSFNIGLLALFVLLTLGACTSPQKVVYFQDLQNGTQLAQQAAQALRLQKGDKIYINVSCDNPQLALPFNLSSVNQNANNGSSSTTISTLGNTNSAQRGQLAYTVDAKGSVRMPVLGYVKVAGLTRQELVEKVAQELVSRNLLPQPIVTVEYANMSASVLGEVGHPGRFALDRDETTLLQLLSMAGDLTLYGNRQHVLVMREAEGKTTSYYVDLTQAQGLTDSPVYYVKQNDVVYVEPIAYRARQTTMNENTVRSTSFWMSFISFITSMSFILFK